jgi:hypothetical protein
MAGYQCVYHDGAEDAIHIHQTLGQPGVISVCNDCQPVYLITTLAATLGVDGGELYEHVRAFQMATQGDQQNQPQPEDSTAPDIPAGPHPAAIVSPDGTVTWGWCACDAPGPHNQDGDSLSGAVLDNLREVACPHCETAIRGTADDIDSGLRKHIEHCDKAHTEEE